MALPLSAPLSRRQLLTSAAGLGCTLSLASWAQTPNAPGNSDLTGQWRAMSRLGYGPTAAQVQQLQRASSPRDWALQQLDAARQASHSAAYIAPELQAINDSLPQIFAGAQRERQARAALKAQDAAAPTEPSARLDFSTPPDALHYLRSMVEKTAVWRLTASSRPDLENPLLARLTEFWFNHFNVYIGKGPVRPFVGHYLINALRANALGRFEDLLLASARHPAMLLYLDQAQSVANGTPGAQGRSRGLNENYARELMELHTLGVDGGYTQNDVREMARVLTGWTVDPRDSSGFRFATRGHDRGSKTVMGLQLPDHWLGSGVAEGEQAIRMLARHPNTARRLSLRLARFFVADTPPPALVQRLTQQFLAHQGDLMEWLRTLLESPEFWQAENRLFKTPMDFACSVLSATESAPQRRAMLLTLGFLRDAGQPLHGWHTPDGYGTDAATWLAPEALTRRADYALQMGQQSVALDFLLPYLGAATRTTVASASARLQPGLVLASPDFMYK